MRIFPMACLFGAATVLAASPAIAHHGWSSYGENEFEVSGTVVSSNLGGPHGLIRVKASEGVWDVVLSPGAGITRAGLTQAAIPSGTRVTARGHRHNAPGRLEIKTERLVVGSRTFDLYPNRP